MHKVTNKTKARRHEFTWGPEQQASFDEFKRILTTSPLFLEYPDLSSPFILTTDVSDVGIGGILRQETPTGTKINYFKSRLLNDIKRKYDTFEKEALAIYWCLTELRPYIGDSDITVETDHKPLENFYKKQINNRRVMNWLFKLQDLLPQLLAVEYHQGANNTAADYISRHFPTSEPINANLPITDQMHDDWPQGSQSWSDDIPKQQRQQFTRSFPPTPKVVYNDIPNIELYAVTTRAQAKLLNQSVPSPPPHSPPSPQPSSLSACTAHTPLYDFSLSRIRSEQEQDPIIKTTLQQVRTKQTHRSFIIQDNIFYKLIRRDTSYIRTIYMPFKLVPELLEAHHNHHLSGHFGVHRTWTMLRDRYYWPRMKETIVSYIRSCNQCSTFNVNRHKPPGFLQPIQPPNDVFQVLGMDWWGPSTPSLHGNKYVLIITDRLSGDVIAKPSPTNSA